MAQEGPGSTPEKGVRFDVGGASTRAEALAFIFEKKFADEGFADAGRLDGTC